MTHTNPSPMPDEREREIEELHALNCKLSDLLTRSVNALRGNPPPLTLWSWHDLPDRIAAAMAALQGACELAGRADRRADPVPALRYAGLLHGLDALNDEGYRVCGAAAAAIRELCAAPVARTAVTQGEKP